MSQQYIIECTPVGEYRWEDFAYPKLDRAAALKLLAHFRKQEKTKRYKREFRLIFETRERIEEQVNDN